MLAPQIWQRSQPPYALPWAEGFPQGFQLKLKPMLGDMPLHYRYVANKSSKTIRQMVASLFYVVAVASWLLPRK